MDSWELLRHLGAPAKTAAADTDATLSGLLDQVESALQVLVGMAAKMPALLVIARSKAEDLPEGRVYQSSVKRHLDDAAEVLENVDTLKYRLEDAELSDEKSKTAWDTSRALFVPRKASVAYAISDIDFAGADITYSTTVLKTWASSLAEWAKVTKSTVTKLRRRAGT